MGSLSLDCYHFYLLMILKETLTFLPLSNLVPQYLSLEHIVRRINIYEIGTVPLLLLVGEIYMREKHLLPVLFLLTSMNQCSPTGVVLSFYLLATLSLAATTVLSAQLTLTGSLTTSRIYNRHRVGPPAKRQRRNLWSATRSCLPPVSRRGHAHRNVAQREPIDELKYVVHQCKIEQDVNSWQCAYVQ